MTLQLAIEWATLGHRVLPVSWTGRKRPLIKQWQLDCTTDPDTIRRWWAKWPEARVGLATGEPGFDVLDFDVADGKPGMEQLEKLLDLGILVPGTFMVVVTPSGGRHLYGRGTDQHNKQNEKTIPGVDFRGVGGMVLAPGNPGYRKMAGWDLDPSELKPIDWSAVAAALAPPEPEPEPARLAPARPAPTPTQKPKLTGKLKPPPSNFDNAPGEESPLDWFVSRHRFADVLAADGWSYGGTDPEGRDEWTRPGKKVSEGTSGNVQVQPDGRETFINRSSTVSWLPTDRAWSIAQYVAYRDHGGSVAALARHVRTTMMPRHETPKTVALVAQPVTQDGPAGTDAPPAPARPGESLPGRELVPISEVGQPETVRDFWQQREVLKRIRWFARERRVAPWAVLGAVLGQASCRIGPHVVLPAIVGGVASLNLLVGLVGPSGKGKGAATAVASEFLGVEGKFMSEEVGTSQGIDSSFSESVPKLGTVQFNDVAFFYVPEIDTVKAHAEMSGSALLPTLRKIWSGEPLGAKYAAKERRRQVRAHAYRAAVVAGIQPKRSGVLLDDVDGGTPQRWLWLPVTDPLAPRRTDRLKAPPYTGTPPHLEWDVWLPCGERRGEKDEPEPVEVKTRYEIPVCREAVNAIIDARELNLVSEAASMDSHSLLTRLKVAALLSFIDGRLEVTAADWELALSVMWISNATRADCQRALAEAEEEEHAKRGRGRAMVSHAEQIAAPIIQNRRVERIQELGGKALGILQSEPGREFSPRELKIATMDAKAVKEFGDDVLTAVIATPGVHQGPEISSGGRKIRKLSWRPVIAPA
jgi:hypothetical protein